MQIVVVGEENMPKAKRAKVIRMTPPTDWQRRCWCIGIAMQMQKEPNIADMLRGSQMIEDYILGKGPPTAALTLLPRQETGGASSSLR